VYEVSFGFLTLAQNAKLATLLVFVLLLIAIGFVGCIFWQYHEAYGEIERDNRSRIRGPRELLGDLLLVYLWGVVVSMVGYVFVAKPWSFLFAVN
jgi:hypothetical protein